MSNKKKKLYFSLLPTDLLIPLFLFFSPQELANTLLKLKPDPEFARLFNSNIFWQKLWKRDISKFRLPKNTEIAYGEYLRIFTTVSPDYLITYFSDHGYEIPLYALDLPQFILNSVLQDVARKGYLDIIETLLPKMDPQDATIRSWITINAVETGQIHIVEYMVENEGPLNYDFIMKKAAEKGDINIVKMMLDQGATAYNWGLEGGAFSGNIDIINLMLDLGANDYDEALSMAALGGQMEAARLMLERGASNYSEAIIAANYAKHKNVADLIRSYQNR